MMRTEKEIVKEINTLAAIQEQAIKYIEENHLEFSHHSDNAIVRIWSETYNRTLELAEEMQKILG